ncbi:MAG: exodeoxyribonuclease VII small subunit [archaeon]|nr:exodeoxyribonuclease VII small subunit [archaeon]
MEEKELTFEESLAKLEELVSKLENRDIPLDDAISKFNEAMILVNNCDEKLKDAHESIAKIIKDNKEIDFNIEE